MALKEKRFDLAHRVEDDTNRDQHPRATEEIGDPGGDVELEEQDVRHDGDDRQEDGARPGSAGS